MATATNGICTRGELAAHYTNLTLWEGGTAPAATTDKQAVTAGWLVSKLADGMRWENFAQYGYAEDEYYTVSNAELTKKCVKTANLWSDSVNYIEPGKTYSLVVQPSGSVTARYGYNISFSALLYTYTIGESTPVITNVTEQATFTATNVSSGDTVLKGSSPNGTFYADAYGKSRVQAKYNGLNSNVVNVTVASSGGTTSVTVTNLTVSATSISIKTGELKEVSIKATLSNGVTATSFSQLNQYGIPYSVTSTDYNYASGYISQKSGAIIGIFGQSVGTARIKITVGSLSKNVSTNVTYSTPSILKILGTAGKIWEATGNTTITLSSGSGPFRSWTLPGAIPYRSTYGAVINNFAHSTGSSYISSSDWNTSSLTINLNTVPGGTYSITNSQTYSATKTLETKTVYGTYANLTFGPFLLKDICEYTMYENANGLSSIMFAPEYALELRVEKLT